VPLFSGFSSFSKRENYASQQMTLELKQKELRESIATQIRSIVQTIEMQRSTVVMQEKAVREAGRAMDIILSSYRNGTASSNDVVQMQRTRYDAGRKYIAAQIGYIQSVLALRQLMGIDLYKAYVE
jgi:outer membrane protein TolC